MIKLGPLFTGFGIGLIAGTGLQLWLPMAFIAGALCILLGTIMIYGG